MISTLVPQLNPSIRISPFGAGHILVECNNHQLKLKKEFEQLFKLINGVNTVNAIATEYASSTRQNISESFIHRLLFNDLADYGVIITNKPVKKRERALHLRLSFIFWKGKSLNVISAALSPLFHSIFFYSSLLLMLLFIIPVLLYFKYNGLANAFEFKNMVLYAVVSFVIILLHELGHVAACHKYGAQHKGIGFGFYLFTPTFFADVSDAWRLPAKQRVIINLAGIYMELIIVTAFFGCFLVTQNEILFYSGVTILLHTLVNLNPFLKYDGYWVLSDITATPNLSKQAFERFKQVLSTPSRKQFSIKDSALLLYALASYGMVAVFLFALFFYDSQSVIRLPVKIANALYHYPTLLNGHITIEKIGRHLSACMFYVLLVRLAYHPLKKYLIVTPQS
jgi:putative peptide zinc metalloprotease protein